jgi:CheY-like chemotaxis protein
VPALRKPGIVVVEDIDDLRELLAEVLTSEGYHAIMARTGVEVMERMESVLPDLVITDLTMPEMTGGELVQRMRATPSLAHVPVLVLTSRERQKALEELGQAAQSVQQILRKPVNLSELLAAVDTALNETRRPPQ